MTTVLTLVQDFTEKMNLPTPSALVGSQDKSVRQYRSLLRELVADLCEHRWQQQKIRGTFTSVAGNDQGDLTSLFSAGFFGLVKDTMWNQTRLMRVYGPLPDPIWAALTVLPNAGPEFQSWIAGNHLYVSPPFEAGETITAIYITQYGVLSPLGVPQQNITNDSDTLLFPDNVVMRGFEYKWRKQKGEAGWEDDYNDFMGLLAKNKVNAGMPTLALDSNPNLGPWPGIIVPPGNWNVAN